MITTTTILNLFCYGDIRQQKAYFVNFERTVESSDDSSDKIMPAPCNIQTMQS